MSGTLQHIFYCAKTGKPFRVEFARPGTGSPYVIKSIKRIEPVRQSSGYRTDSPKRTFATLSPQDVDFNGLQCPHCSAQHALSYVHCGKCNRDMCLGASSRKMWRCSPECGEEARLNGMGTIRHHKFAKAEQAFVHRKAVSPSLLTHAVTPVMERLFSVQKTQGREAAMVEQPKSQSRALIIRRTES